MSNPIDLSRFSAATFDVYGTSLNWEPEISRFLAGWIESQGLQFSAAELLILYDRLRQPLQKLRPIYPYPEILMRTLDAMAEELRCELPDHLRREFGQIAATHQPYPDSREALLGLRSRGLKLGALSNIDEESFAHVLKILNVPFDVIVTAERVGTYKPDLSHFRTMLSDMQALGIPRSRVLHIAQSRRADIVPANALGLTCVWVNRSGHLFGRQGDGAEMAKPDYEVPDLAAILES